MSQHGEMVSKISDALFTYIYNFWYNKGVDNRRIIDIMLDLKNGGKL